MGCRCKERGAAIARAVTAIRQRQTQEAADNLRFVAQTAAEDVGSIFRQKIAIARQRLTRR